MNRFLLRIVAVLMAPCLLVGPSLYKSFDQPPVTPHVSTFTQEALSLPQISSHQYLKLGVLVVASGLGISSILLKTNFFTLDNHVITTNAYQYDSFALDRPIQSNLKVIVRRGNLEISDLPPEYIFGPMGASPSNSVPLAYRMRLADGSISEAFGWSSGELSRWLEIKPDSQGSYQRSLKKILSMLSHALDLTLDVEAKKTLSDMFQSAKTHLSGEPGEHYEFAAEYPDGTAGGGTYGRVSAGSTEAHFGPDVVWVGLDKGDLASAGPATRVHMGIRPDGILLVNKAFLNDEKTTGGTVSPGSSMYDVLVKAFFVNLENASEHARNDFDRSELEAIRQIALKRLGKGGHAGQTPLGPANHFMGRGRPEMKPGDDPGLSFSLPAAAAEGRAGTPTMTKDQVLMTIRNKLRAFAEQGVEPLILRETPFPSDHAGRMMDLWFFKQQHSSVVGVALFDVDDSRQRVQLFWPTFDDRSFDLGNIDALNNGLKRVGVRILPPAAPAKTDESFDAARRELYGLLEPLLIDVYEGICAEREPGFPWQALPFGNFCVLVAEGMLKTIEKRWTSGPLEFKKPLEPGRRRYVHDAVWLIHEGRKWMFDGAWLQFAGNEVRKNSPPFGLLLEESEITEATLMRLGISDPDDAAAHSSAAALHPVAPGDRRSTGSSTSG